VREDGRLVGGKGWKEEAPEIDNESSHSAHANEMNE
jgi:hypothetical protein